MIGVLAQSAVVDLNQLALLAVGLLVVIAILGAGVQAYLTAQAQRNLNDIHSMGIQAVVAQNQQSNLADELQETDENNDNK
jgi:23S rRNA maturation mini-RNase III